MPTTAEQKEFFGPLATLIGKWQGDKGMDVAPVMNT